MAGVRYAWCQELDEAVQAREAKREYLASQPKPAKFRFFCQYEDCLGGPKGTPTRVTCVNYQAAPSEKEQSVVVHYREWDEHDPECPDFDPATAGKAGKEGDRVRKGSVKVSDAIDVFDPADEPPSAGIKLPQSDGHPGASSGRPSNGKSGKLNGPRGKGVSSTRFIEDVAAVHYAAVRAKKDDPEAAAVLARPISVPSQGTISFEHLFKSIRFSKFDDTLAVWYGWADFKKFGDGFALNFRDKLDGLVLSTYISPDAVRQYRYRKQLWELMEQAERCSYVTGYVWGRVTPSDRDGKVKLQPSRLQHLAFIPGPQKPTESPESSRSKNANK